MAKQTWAHLGWSVTDVSFAGSSVHNSLPSVGCGLAYFRHILNNLCWYLKHKYSNPKRRATGPSEVVWRVCVKVPRQHPLKAKWTAFKNTSQYWKRFDSSSWCCIELGFMTLFWERGMVLFQDGKKPTNIPPHCFCGSLDPKRLSMRALETKALCLLIFFSYWCYFFRLAL